MDIKITYSSLLGASDEVKHKYERETNVDTLEQLLSLFEECMHEDGTNNELVIDKWKDDDKWRIEIYDTWRE